MRRLFFSFILLAALSPVGCAGARGTGQVSAGAKGEVSWAFESREDGDGNPHTKVFLVVGVRGPSSQSQSHHSLGNLRVQGRNARWPRLIAPETGNAVCAEPVLPPPDDGFGLAGPLHNFTGTVPIGGQEHDLCPPDMLLWTVTIGDDCRQLSAVSGTQLQSGSRVHSPDSHGRVRKGIHKRIEMSELVP